MSETPSLIEAVARAIAERDGHAFDAPDDGYYVPLARAALSAIEQAGFVVVPVEPTPSMLRAGAFARHSTACDGQYSIVGMLNAEAAYPAMLSARPKVVKP